MSHRQTRTELSLTLSRAQEYDARGMGRLDAYCLDPPARFGLTPTLAAACLAATAADHPPVAPSC